MNDAALMTVDLGLRRVSVPAEVLAMKDAALAGSALIAKVNSPESNQRAVEAQQGLSSFARLIEKSRKMAKEPVLDFARAIDAKAQEIVSEVKNEELRVATLIGNYQQDLLAQQRIAERQKQVELERIERERQEATRKAAEEAQAAMAAAKRQEDKDAAMAKAQADAMLAAERARQDAEAIKKAPEPVRATGQIVHTKKDFRVINERELSQARPDLVEITPRRREILDAIGRGEVIPGITVFEVTTSSTRSVASKTLELE
jgi:membrane protein involved in colicin uptake